MGGVLKSRLVLFGVLVVTALMLTLPAILGPVRFNDSFWIDMVWLDQFSSELRHGILYPRWLPLSHNGLGSPVFYYYPPLAFYAASPFVLAGLTVYGALIATFLVGYVLSGLGTYFWLKDQSRMPLVGALFYMAAPYHAFDFYLRGAVAEFMAAAALPFVMYGLRSISQKRQRGLPIAAISYAAIIASHLPLALLASLFLFGPYSLILIRRDRSLVLPFAGAFALGISVACIYLVPALLLEPYRDAAKLWENVYWQPKNWSFWNRSDSLPPGYPGALITALTLALPLAGIFAWKRSGWAVYGLVCVVLAIGTIPIMWTLPLLRSVQFPFRLLPVAEFALATSIAAVPLRKLPIALAAAPLLAATAIISAVPATKPHLSMALHPDVPENLPPGKRPFSWPSHWALELAATHRQPQVVNGTTIEPVFYFPAWRVLCDGQEVATWPDKDTQLLSYRGRNCTRSVVWTSAEKLGAAASLLGLLALTAMSAARRFRRRV